MSKVVNDDDNKVFIITSKIGDKKSGFVITWISEASLNRKNPKIIMVVSNFNAGLSTLEKSHSFCLNLLSKDQLKEFYTFGVKSSTSFDKFAHVDHVVTGRGIEIKGCAGYVHGRIDDIFSTPDRKILYCTIEEERETGRPQMILNEVLGQLEEPWKSELKLKFERDSLRDENQFL
ncbi:MAG TPA: flavin reductase [Bacteriovoracaceae bacterium]|nr:flavin reductase [Bacteriovoracaceae bacterium]